MLNFTRLDELRARRPLLHCVSNIVTANDCANLALAVGASPIMAQAPEEMEEITACSDATVLNTGTPDTQRFQSCELCGAAAQAIGQPVILDPVGVGAGSWRRANVTALLEKFHPSILRVNLSEARALLGYAQRERGVDCEASDGEEARLRSAVELARRYQTVVLLSGRQDVVTDGSRALGVCGGSERMTAVTGTGCMLSVLCGAFAAVEPDLMEAAALAAAFWKTCAEEAARRSLGPGSFRTALLDQAGTMTVQRVSSAPILALTTDPTGFRP